MTEPDVPLGGSRPGRSGGAGVCRARHLVAVLALASCGTPSPTPARPDAPRGSEAATISVQTAAPTPVGVAPSASVAAPLPSSAAAASAPSPPARRSLLRGARFDNPTAMAVDDTSLYVESAGRLLVVPKDGSAPPEPVFSVSTMVADLVVEGPHLYVSAALTDLAAPALGAKAPGPLPGGAGMGAIVRVDRRTREAKVLAPHRMPSAIGVDDANVWFGALDQRVWRIPREGGTPRPVAGVVGTVYAIDFDAKDVYFAASTYGGRQRGAIYAAPRRGGPARVVVDGLFDAMSVRVLGADLFFNDSGTVKMRAVGGGEPRMLNEEGSAISIARNDEGVFWCSIDLRGEGAAIGAYRPSDGVARVLATGPAPVGIAVDEGAVYWADAAAREVVAMALR